MTKRFRCVVCGRRHPSGEAQIHCTHGADDPALNPIRRAAIRCGILVPAPEPDDAA
jgi:hypothetical protein